MELGWGRRARSLPAWVLGALACANGGPEAAPSPSPTPSGGSAGDRYFPAEAPWYQDITSAPLDRESAAVIAFLDRVGWGYGRMQIDFSLEVVEAPAGTPPRPFQPTGDFFTPDCDREPVPVPPGGALEGESGYACLNDGDCHLIVVDRSRQRLFEMWRADIRGETFNGGCLAVWDMTRLYPASGRGEQCSSADAAGYPITPLLFTADEVARGSIDHAIRFILPNERIRRGEYLHPATHGTRAASGPPDSPPYGSRLRLRPDFPLDRLPNAGARVVARAMQKYGILLADGGNVALTARSDRFTRAKWDGLLGPRDLDTIRPGDFAMIEGGPRIGLTLDCARNP
jgi:hypothetical protein